MKKRNKNKLFLIIFLTFTISVFHTIPSIVPIYEPKSVHIADWGPNDDWHEGSAIETPEVDVEYWESYSSYDTDIDKLEQRMLLLYKDGTRADAGFVNRLLFYDGGLDVDQELVLDWSKIRNTDPIFFSSSIVNSSISICADYKFNGFHIYMGNSNNLPLKNYTSGPGYSIKPDMDKKIGQIDILEQNYRIGDIILSTNDVIYNGETITESVAEFDVVFNATIGDSTETRDIKVIYQFEVRHMNNETSYKFGVDIDWTGNEDFPTKISMNTGDEFCLVAQDRLSVQIGESQGTDKEVISTFDVNNENDTATFTYNSQEVCEQYFPTKYNINGTSPDYNTNRIYVKYSPSSRVFVFFDGFKYNQSTSFKFDPKVVIPCSLVSGGDQIPFGSHFLGITAVTVIALVVIIKKRHIFIK